MEKAIAKEVKKEMKKPNSKERRRARRTTKQVEKTVVVAAKREKPKQKNKPRAARDIVVRNPRVLRGGKGDIMPGSCDDSGNGNIINQYTNCLIDPKNNMCRYPDGDLRPTGLFRTVEVFEVPALYEAGNKTGRFSACLRPYLGSTVTPNQFHAGIAVNPLGSDDWQSVDWSQASNYSVDNGGSNPRIDKNKPFMTASQGGFFFMEAESELTAPQVAPVTGNFLFGLGIHDQDFGDNNTGINIKILTGRNDTFVVPYGTWLFTVAQEYVSAVAGPITVGITANGSTVTNYIQETVGFPTTNQTSITGIGSAGDAYYSFVVNSSPGANLLRINTYQNTSATVLPAGVLSNIATLVNFSPVVLESQFNTNPSAGVIEEVRPIAQGVLCTYMGTDFENGGMIAVHYAPPDLIDSNFYQNAGDQRGQLQYYENLASIPGAYDGRVSKGAYAWWAPYTKTDEAFRNVGAANQYRLPGIVVSGTHTVNEAPTVAGSDKVMRLEVFTVYEYTTACSALELKELRGSDLIIDRCNNALSAQSHTMENEAHIEFLRRMFKNLLTFAIANKEVIVKIGALAVSVL